MKKIRSVSWIMIIAFLFTLVPGKIATASAADVEIPKIVKEIDAGVGYSLILKSDGTVWFWGYNHYGELGSGNYLGTSRARKINELNNIVSVSAGANHTAALSKDGSVWTWGYNSYGQLGNGTTADSIVPVKVEGLTGVIAISAGKSHTLALKKDGTIWAFGDNSSGQIGDGTKEKRLAPVQVNGLPYIASIESGDGYSLALEVDGTLWAWGKNGNGQLGDGTTEDRSLPIKHKTFTGIKAVSTGSNHSIALKNDGSVWSWGSNTEGQLGDGTNTQVNTPKMISTLSGIVKIDSGDSFSMALKDDGSVWTWGANYYCQLGIGSVIGKNVPAKIQGLSNITSIAAGHDHAIVLKDDGTLWTWGNNGNAQLADNTLDVRSSPIKPIVDTVFPFAVSSKPYNDEAGATVYKPLIIKFSENMKPAYGYDNITVKDSNNNAVELNKELNGDTLTLTPETPLKFNTAYKATIPADAITDGGENCLLNDYSFSFKTGDALSIAVNVENTAPVDNEAHVRLDSKVRISFYTGIMSGDKFDDITLKDSKQNNIAIEKKIDENVLTISPKVPLTLDTSYSVMIPSEALKKGDGGSMTGDYTINFTTLLPNDIVAATAGIGHSMAISSHGRLYTWGQNNSGQLGHGTVYNHTPFGLNIPYPIPGLQDVVAAAGGSTRTLALKKDGTVYAWGFGGLAVTSLSDESKHPSPAKVLNLTDIIALSASDGHSLALKKDGTVYAWGRNEYGQLGDGGRSSQKLPVKIPVLSDVIAISAGTRHSIALKKDGTVFGWGYSTPSFTPVQISGLKDVTSISAGEDYSLALKSDGTVYMWDHFGGRTVKDKDGDMTGMTSVSAGFGKSMALKSDGTVWEWIGKGQSYMVDGLKDIVSISIKGHSLAVQKDGSVWAWGGNEYGQLGDGTNDGRTIPVKSITRDVPLKVSYTQPSVNSTRAPIASPIALVFSKNIVKGQNFDGIKLSGKNGEIKISKSVINNMLVLTPSSYLSFTTDYKVTIPAEGVKGEDGSLLGESYELAFTTERPEDSKNPPLLVLETNPSDGSKIIPLDSPITVRFNMSIQPDINFSGISLKDPSGTSAAASVSIKNNILTIKPASELKSNTLYTGTIPVDALKDLGSNMMMNDYVFRFTTKYAQRTEYARYSGQDRYGTSLNISMSGWASSQNAVLTTGEDFPDALAAAPLAKKLNAPILLTGKSRLSSAIKDELGRLGVKQVFLVGGEGVISKTVADELKNIGIDVIRIFGNDRYQTSLEIAKHIEANFGMAGEIVVATGEDFPDALSIAPIAADKGIPIILSPKTDLTDAAKSFISDSKVKKAYVIGGSGVLNDKVMSNLPNPERIWGTDRYVTNVKVIDRFKDDINFGTTYIATGEDFPDALAGSALAPKTSSPIILVGRAVSPAAKNFISSINGPITAPRALGGYGAVADSAVQDLIPPLDTDNAANTTGNTVGNMANGAFASEQGDWIYYYNPNDYYFYREKKDGSEKIALVYSSDTITSHSGRIMNVNAVGDFIYYTSNNARNYSGLYRIRKDGSSNTLLSAPYSNSNYNNDSSHISNVNVIGDTVYYLHLYSHNIFRMKSDGSQLTKVSGLTGHVPDVLVAADNWFYFIDYADNKSMYKMQIENDAAVNVTRISSDSASHMNITGDWIFYSNKSDGGRIYKIKTDGTSKTKINDNKSDYVNISGNSIYYSNQDDSGRLYKMNIDGSEKAKLSDESAAAVNIAGDWIFYLTGSSLEKLYKVRTDGTGTLLVE